MYLVYFCSLIVTVISQSASCDYGNFQYDPTTSQCMFNCEYAGTYVDISTLSFDFIAEQCNDVGDAAKIGLCSELNDLEFPMWATTCQCPRCSCTTKDLVTIDSFEQVLQKECYNCTCGDDPTYSTLALQCAQLYSVSSPYNWNDFTCQYPAISCTDSVSSTTYYPGQGWFAANSDSSPCETYCYCNPDGSVPCETGFENIVNSADSGLVAAFKDTCGQDIDSCTNDPSRMTSRYTGSCGRSSCPYCDCGTRVLGDQWHSEYSKTSSLTTCALCSCESSNVTECGDEETYASGSSSTCPGPNTLSCHDGSGSGTDSKLAADQVLNPVECATNFPDVWCSWQFQAGETIDNEYWDWRCDTSPFCGTYGSNDACFYGEYTVSYTDCNGVVQTQTEKQYTYCCNTADCNLKDVDITACKENTQFSSLMENLFSCVYGSYLLLIGCPTSTFISETTTCAAVEEMYGSLFDCYCNSYGGILYQDAPTEWQVFIEEQMDVLRDQAYDSDWNDALPCDINLQCDLTATETPVTTTTQSVDATTPGGDTATTGDDTAITVDDTATEPPVDDTATEPPVDDTATTTDDTAATGGSDETTAEGGEATTAEGTGTTIDESTGTTEEPDECDTDHWPNFSDCNDCWSFVNAELVEITGYKLELTLSLQICNINALFNSRWIIYNFEHAILEVVGALEDSASLCDIDDICIPINDGFTIDVIEDNINPGLASLGEYHPATVDECPVLDEYCGIAGNTPQYQLTLTLALYCGDEGEMRLLLAALEDAIGDLDTNFQNEVVRISKTQDTLCGQGFKYVFVNGAINLVLKDENGNIVLEEVIDITAAVNRARLNVMVFVVFMLSFFVQSF